MTFAGRLFVLRKQKKLTQLTLAQRLQITQEAVSRYELGRGVPRYLVLISMAQELDTTADYLLGMTNEQLCPPTPEIFSEQERQVIAKLSHRAQERAIGYLHGANENQNKA